MQIRWAMGISLLWSFLFEVVRELWSVLWKVPEASKQASRLPLIIQNVGQMLIGNSNQRCGCPITPSFPFQRSFDLFAGEHERILTKENFHGQVLMKENLHFVDRLKELMRQRGVNNVELAAAIGVSHVAIGNFLKGQLPKSEHLYALSKFFDVSMEYLLGVAEPKNQRPLREMADLTTDQLTNEEIDRYISQTATPSELEGLQKMAERMEANLSSVKRFLEQFPELKQQAAQAARTLRLIEQGTSKPSSKKKVLEAADQVEGMAIEQVKEKKRRKHG